MRGLYRRGNVWWVRFSHAGKQHFVSTGETDEARAIVAARKVLDRPHQITGGPLRVELTRYLDELEKQGRKRVYLRSLRTRLLGAFSEAFDGTPSLASINAAQLQRWHDHVALSASPYTAAAYLADVRRFFKWAVLRHKVRLNPCDQVRAPHPKSRSRTHWLEPGVATKLLALCPDLELRFCLYCGLDAGLRHGEVTVARPEWFDLRRGTVRVLRSEHWKWRKDETRFPWSPKNGRERTIPLTDRFGCFLKTLFPLRGPYLVQPEVPMGTSLYRVDFYNRLRAYRKKAGVEFCFHDLRHTFASRLVQHDVSAFKVAEFLGDRIEEVERTYGHLRPYDRSINRGI
jgi:integrase